MDLLLATLPLFGVIVVGALAGAVRLFPAPNQAIAVLNRFTLYLAFPVLIATSLASTGFSMPGGYGFYVIHAVGAALLLPLALGVGRAATRRTRDALVIGAGAIFGNIAYLGIPYCTAVLGPEATGLASLSAALHIIIAMTLAPLLLDRAAAGPARALATTLVRVARQPLVWAPLAGLLLRQLPSAVRRPLLDGVGPLGQAAGPVALFMIGLYLWERRGLLRRGRLGAGVGALTVLKLAAYPALVWGLVVILEPILPVSALQRSVLVLLAAMPVAVTTFSLAEDFGVGRETISVGIVVSTLASLVTLTIVASLVT